MTKGKPQPIPPKSIPQCSLADRFSDYFTNKVTDLRRGLNDSPLATLSVFSEELHFPTKFDKCQTVTPKQVQSVIKSSPTKTCGLDPVANHDINHQFFFNKWRRT